MDKQLLEFLFAAAAGCGLVGTVGGLIISSQIKKIVAASERVPDQDWFDKMGRMADLVTEHHVKIDSHERRISKLEDSKCHGG